MPEHELPLTFCNPSAFAFDAETAIALLADMHIRKAIERWCPLDGSELIPPQGKHVPLNGAWPIVTDVKEPW